MQTNGYRLQLDPANAPFLVILGIERDTQGGQFQHLTASDEHSSAYIDAVLFRSSTSAMTLNVPNPDLLYRYVWSLLRSITYVNDSDSCIGRLHLSINVTPSELVLATFRCSSKDCSPLCNMLSIFSVLPFTSRLFSHGRTIGVHDLPTFYTD